jgi:hypothetical protein
MTAFFHMLLNLPFTPTVPFDAISWFIIIIIIIISGSAAQR